MLCIKWATSVRGNSLFVLLLFLVWWWFFKCCSFDTWQFVLKIILTDWRWCNSLTIGKKMKKSRCINFLEILFPCYTSTHLLRRRKVSNDFKSKIMCHQHLHFAMHGREFKLQINCVKEIAAASRKINRIILKICRTCCIRKEAVMKIN